MSPSIAPMLRVASIPLVARRGDSAQNLARVIGQIEEAGRRGIGLAVFPEACITGTGGAKRTPRAELDALAERIDGSSIGAVADAVERTGVAAGVGLIERTADGQLFNSYVVCMPGGQRHCHRKLHGGEHRRIRRGDRYTVFDTVWGLRIAILIGGDNYLVENVRMTALMGATLLVAPHAGASGAAGCGWMRRVLPARALDNGMFVVFSDGGERGDGVGANASGSANGSASSAAAIVDPCGQIIAESLDAENMISADLDTVLIGTSMGHRWLDARRPDLYGQLARGSRDDGARPASVAFEPRSVSARGSVPVSFAVVRRERAAF